MSRTALPLISESDFPAFQQLIPELRATTYAEWVEDHKKAVAYRKTRNGSVDVPVSPNGFNAWLRATKQCVHLELLWAYAESKAAAAVPVVGARFIR